MGYKHEHVCADIWRDLIWESNDVKHIGITIDRDLKFDKHVLKLCRKANQKLSALSRIAKLFSFNKRRKLLWSLNLNNVRLFGYFIIDAPATELIS